MKSSWEKEDRVHYKNSEVMQELESMVLKTISRIDILNKKAHEGQATGDDVDNQVALNKALGETVNLNNQLAADDGETEDGESADGHTVVIEDNQADDGQVKEAAIEELRELATIAVEKGNYKLAYKIERTIDEITEEVVICEL